MTSGEGHIRAEIPASGVGLITIDRPEKRNALTARMIEAFEAAFDAFASDPAIRAIVLTGAGDKAFSSGHDLKDLDDDDLSPLYDEAHMQVFMRPAQTDKPVIAAVNGAALAGGFCLVIHSDLRLAAPSAWFAIPAASLGIVPIAGQSARLPHLLPPAVVSEMVMAGARLGAARAEALGFVNKVVPAETLVAEAVALAARIAAASAVSVAGYKRILATTLFGGVAEADALEYALAREAGEGTDVREGLAAFRARRPPRFGGGAP